MDMRVAKLGIKIMVALFVAGYEYDIIDSPGKFPKSLPTPDYIDIHKVKVTFSPLWCSPVF
jgi:sterol 14-demethylase